VVVDSHQWFCGWEQYHTSRRVKVIISVLVVLVVLVVMF